MDFFNEPPNRGKKVTLLIKLKVGRGGGLSVSRKLMTY